MERQHPDEESFLILRQAAEGKRVAAGMGMKTNSVSFSSDDRDILLSTRFDGIPGSRSEISTGVRHIVESDLFVVIGVD